MIEQKLKEGFKKFCPEKELPKDAECAIVKFEKKHYLVELFPRGAWAGIGRIWAVFPPVETKGKPMSVWKAEIEYWKKKDKYKREYLAKFLEAYERKEGLYESIESTEYFDHFN